MDRIVLEPAPLARDAFAPFGDVIETAGRASFPINGGLVTRFHDLAEVDVLEAGGRPIISIFRARVWPRPLRVTVMERHPRSSQAFVPVDGNPFIVVVAAPDGEPDPGALHAFLSDGRQGVSYRRGTWHHPILALETESDFVVFDRGADDANCDEVAIDPARHEVVVSWP